MWIFLLEKAAISDANISLVYDMGDRGWDDHFVWFYAWSGKPIVESVHGATTPAQQCISLRDADPIRYIMHLDRDNFEPIQFMDRRDAIVWRWTTHGTYTAKSVYSTICGGGKIGCKQKMVWSIRAPPTVRIFTYL